MGSPIERVQVKLPPGFDPAKHESIIAAMVIQSCGPGFEIESVDLDRGMATATRQASITEVIKEEVSDSFQVRLGAHVAKPSEGDKAAAKFADQYPGYFMVKFDPYLGKATLGRLSEDEVRCRGAVAVALGVKPWDVSVSTRPDGGYDLILPKNYSPAKADKIQEVASEVVGRAGWYAKIDAQKLTASLIPADPPTFPGAIKFPMKRLGRGDSMSTPFGHILPGPGEPGGEEIVIDWRASGSALIAGIAGGGKSVAITAILADRVSNGAALAIIDTVDKSVDFKPFMDLCAVESVDGKTIIPTWGCDSLGHSVAVLAMLCDEGKRRAKVLAELGINNWLSLPEEHKFDPIFIIADEYEALVARVPEPKALPKDHPIRIEAIEENMAHDLIAHYMNRIVKEFRFVGLNPLISTQVSNANTGLPPSLKSKMGHFVLCGSTPSEAARRQTFPDEKSVPKVPDNVAMGGDVARGTGSAKIEGGGAYVFKSYFAQIDDYQNALAALGVKRYTDKQVTPTARQIDDYLPRLDDSDADDSQKTGRGSGPELAPSGRPAAAVAAEMGDTMGVAMHDGSLGTGYEKANAIRNLAAGGGTTRKQKKEQSEDAAWAGQSGEVTVRKAPQSVPDTSGDDW